MVGGPIKDKKFIQKIMKQINNGQTELNIVNDKMGTPNCSGSLGIPNIRENYFEPVSKQGVDLLMGLDLKGGGNNA